MIALAQLCGSAAAQTVDIPKSLICSFSKVASSRFTGSWNDDVRDSAPLDLTFVAIDVQDQTARVIGDNGTPATSAYLRGNALHFVEMNQSDMALTTVWLRTDRTRLPAAHSRHTVAGAVDSLSQYRGFCDARF